MLSQKFVDLAIGAREIGPAFAPEWAQRVLASAAILAQLGPLRALVDVLRALTSPVAGRAVAEEVVLERKGRDIE
jgi:hypothetical protein